MSHLVETRSLVQPYIAYQGEIMVIQESKKERYGGVLFKMSKWAIRPNQASHLKMYCLVLGKKR